MKSFNEYVESIVDPKRNPKNNYVPPRPSPEDDDYDPDKEQPEDDDDDNYHQGDRSQLGLTAQYPLAHAEKNPKGFQVMSPEDYFNRKDKMSGREFIDTLRSKLYSGEKMTMGEINFITKVLNKELELTKKTK